MRKKFFFLILFLCSQRRTAANESNTFYKLNPEVSDLPDELSKDVNGVKLLVMGTVDTGGSGCVCPEHVMLKAILSNLVFRKDDVVFQKNNRCAYFPASIFSLMARISSTALSL